MRGKRFSPLVLSAALLCTTAINQPVQTNALALVYARFPQTPDTIGVRGVSAVLTLPAKHNKDWYANWIMITGYAANGTGPNLVQIGLIRFPDQGNNLHAFIAQVQYPAVRMMAANPMPPPVVYQDLGAVTEGNHGVGIAWNRDGFTFTLDNAVAGSKIAVDIAKPVVQAGAETHRAGDAVSGAVTGLLVTNGATTIAVNPQASHCIVEQFGGVLTADSNLGFTASGIADPTARTKYTGDCKEALQGASPG